MYMVAGQQHACGTCIYAHCHDHLAHQPCPLFDTPLCASTCVNLNLVVVAQSRSTCRVCLQISSYCAVVALTSSSNKKRAAAAYLPQTTLHFSSIKLGTTVQLPSAGASVYGTRMCCIKWTAHAKQMQYCLLTLSTIHSCVLHMHLQPRQPCRLLVGSVRNDFTNDAPGECDLMTLHAMSHNGCNTVHRVDCHIRHPLIDYVSHRVQSCVCWRAFGMQPAARPCSPGTSQSNAGKEVVELQERQRPNIRGVAATHT